MTQEVRVELRAQGTLVVGVHAGYIETEMTAHLTNVAKSRPDDVANAALDGIEAGEEEVLADRRAREVRTALTADLRAMEATMQKVWDQRPRR